MILTHDLTRSITLAEPVHEAPLWTYVYGGKAKPFFHPLCTPAGRCLTLMEPWDHVWHRGLWFTIKFVNGENFWEERPPFGTQRMVLPPTIVHGAGGRIDFNGDVEWVRPESGAVVIREHRKLAYVPIDADAYAIDLDTTLTPTTDVVLDRTPYTTWGGYGGFTFRGNRNWMSTRLLFSDGTTSDRPLGVPAKWVDLSGNIDGGEKSTAGVAMFDHPSNRRHPTPWYGGTGPGHYFNAAFLFHEPMTVAAGEPLTFKYRVIVHDGVWDADRLGPAYKTYANESSGA